MSDPLPPRPQYGEYATPEEQPARIRQPDAAMAHVAEPVTPAPDTEGARGASAPKVEPRSRMTDRIITFALLAYGFVNLITTFPALVDYSGYADTVFNLMGVDVELSDPAAGRAWGIAAALVLAIGWVITALVSWWSLQRGRRTWWIPVVGAIVFTVASGILMLVPLMSDPAVWDVLVGGV